MHVRQKTRTKNHLQQISSVAKERGRFFSCTVRQELVKHVLQVGFSDQCLDSFLICAECVAELTKRPLLSITSGDLGTDTGELDKKLSIFFRLGELWNAIVVVDEADIYFEAREANDIARNSLVSGTQMSATKRQAILNL